MFTYLLYIFNLRVTAPSDLRPFLDFSPNGYVPLYSNFHITYADVRTAALVHSIDFLLLFFRIVFFVLIMLYSSVSW